MNRRDPLRDLRPGLTLDNRHREKIFAAVVAGPQPTPTRRAATADRARTWWLVVVAGTAWAITTLLSGNSLLPKDFLTYRYAASDAARGIDVYLADVSGPHLSGQPFTYTPVASIVLWPTTLFTAPVAFAGWTVASAIVLAAVLTATLHRTDTSRRGHDDVTRSVVALVALMVVLGWTDLVHVQIHSGQINLLLMGLCLGDLFLPRSSRLTRLLPSGVLVGVAAAIKLTPALFVVYFLLTRQWRRAGWAVGGLAVASAVGAVLRPRMTSTFVRHVVWTLSDRVNLRHPVSFYGNQSVTGVLAALGVTGVGALLVVLAVVAAALAAAARLHRRRREFQAWLVVGLSAPLVSPFSWTHHHVFVLPALAALAQRWWSTRPAATAAVAGAVLVVLHLHEHQGEMWLRSGAWWQVVPGVLVRDNVLLAAGACILALAIDRRPAGEAFAGARTAGPADVAEVGSSGR